jgi:hypothetical protein
MIPLAFKRYNIMKILRMKPDVVTRKIGVYLKKAQRKAFQRSLGIIMFAIIAYFIQKIIGFNVIISDSQQNFSNTSLPTNHIPLRFLTNIPQSVEIVWSTYIIIVVVATHLAIPAILIYILTLLECYMDHLVASIKKSQVRSLSLIKKNKFPSDEDPENIDINYIVCVHQFIIK